MSRFLAPIHTWLFGKIKLYEDLEKNIISAYSKKYGTENIDKIVNEAINKYGEYIEDKPLEEIIDVSNIHGWLQSKIINEESRSAYIFKKILLQYNDKTSAFDEVEKQAKYCADKIKNAASPENVFERLNEFILEGMPCDRVNMVIEKSENKIVWRADKCIHLNNYITGEGNVEFMYELRDVWIKTFVENVDFGYEYNVSRENDKSEHTIIKK